MAAPKRLKEFCIALFQFTCQYCERTGGMMLDPDASPWHLDRIKPGFHGGEYTTGNVTLSCRHCNSSKGDSWPWIPVESAWDRLISNPGTFDILEAVRVISANRKYLGEQNHLMGVALGLYFCKCHTPEAYEEDERQRAQWLKWHNDRERRQARKRGEVPMLMDMMGRTYPGRVYRKRRHETA